MFLKNSPPTLKEILSHRESSDASNILVNKHNSKEPRNPKMIYEGPIDNIPEDVLNLPISAWLRKDGIYISEDEGKLYD